MREKYESLSAGELREVAKARGLKGISALRKDELVQRMLEEDAKEQEKQIEDKKAEFGQLDSGIEANGILEVLADGYGFIRSDNYMPDILLHPLQDPPAIFFYHTMASFFIFLSCFIIREINENLRYEHQQFL